MIYTAPPDDTGLTSNAFGCTRPNTLVRGVSPVGSVSASAYGRGRHRRPAPLKPDRNEVNKIEKRTEKIKFWLSEKENKEIMRNALKLGMNRSEYIRHLIAHCKPVHNPKIDYEKYYSRFKALGDELDAELVKLDTYKDCNEKLCDYLCCEMIDLAEMLSSETSEKIKYEIENTREDYL